MIPDIKASAKITMERVWFVDIVTDYGPGHFVPTHVTLEQCAEILNAEYTAIVDQACQLSIGTEKWIRVLRNSRNPTLHDFAQLRKQRQYYLAFVEIKTQLSGFFELSIWVRSLLKNIKNNSNYIVIYLDSANPLQLLAVWLSVASSLAATRNKTIVWTHFHGITGWQETKIGRLVRYLFNILPIKTLRTAYTREIAAEGSKYGWVDILPMPLSPDLSVFARNHKSFGEKSDRLVCWLLITRSEQGLDFLPRMMSHSSTRNFPQKFIKCFVSEKANITANTEIELVRLPYGSEDYRLHFNECDVVLLPYNGYSFRSKMSMVFIEAVATSKLPVVSDGTVMASELRRFKLEDLVLDFKNGFSWTLIDELRKDLSIRERFNFMAESYAKEHDTFAYAQSLYKSLKQMDAKMVLTEPKRN
jgi:hypothetical protein